MHPDNAAGTAIESASTEPDHFAQRLRLTPRMIARQSAKRLSSADECRTVGGKSGWTAARFERLRTWPRSAERTSGAVTGGPQPRLTRFAR